MTNFQNKCAYAGFTVFHKLGIEKFNHEKVLKTFHQLYTLNKDFCLSKKSAIFNKIPKTLDSSISAVWAESFDNFFNKKL